MNFEEARVEYGRLRQAYDQRQISADEYGRRVQGLQVRDGGGTYWAIDGNTGGWLRYDGNSWVPGQPPAPQGPPPGQFGGPPAGGFGQPQGNFGQPQQGGTFGQPQGGFGGQPQSGVGSAPAAPAKRSRRGLAIGCGVALVLLLLCGGIGGFLAFRAFGTSGITAAGTASSLTSSNRPESAATEFTVNQPMFITYTAQNVKQGEKLELRLFRDGTRENLTGGERTFDQDATFYGSFSYTPTAAGSYRGEFYYNGASTPAQTINFTVR